jgi:hypothetical protein
MPTELFQGYPTSCGTTGPFRTVVGGGGGGGGGCWGSTTTATTGTSGPIMTATDPATQQLQFQEWQQQQEFLRFQLWRHRQHKQQEKLQQRSIYTWHEHEQLREYALWEQMEQLRHLQQPASSPVSIQNNNPPRTWTAHQEIPDERTFCTVIQAPHAQNAVGASGANRRPQLKAHPNTRASNWASTTNDIAASFTLDGATSSGTRGGGCGGIFGVMDSATSTVNSFHSSGSSFVRSLSQWGNHLIQLGNNATDWLKIAKSCQG